MFNMMIRRSTHRFVNWYRKNRNFRRSRKISDHRATAAAMRQIMWGAMRNPRLNGSPLERAES